MLHFYSRKQGINRGFEEEKEKHFFSQKMNDEKIIQRGGKHKKDKKNSIDSHSTTNL